MAIQWEEVEDLPPEEQLKMLIETRAKFQTLVSQEVWEELCEIAKGQAANLLHEAENAGYGHDAMIQRECLRAEAKGLNRLIETPGAVIEEFDHTIKALRKEIDDADPTTD